MAGTTCPPAKAYLDGLSDLLRAVDSGVIDALTDLVHRAWREDRRVFVFGNGGSAYTASHQVTDLVKTAAVAGRKRLSALSLVDNVGLTTALGNDISYDETFAYPLATYARPGDLALAITCSGNSPNVLRACAWAREHGVAVVALTGFSGGKVKDLADLHINVPSENYGMIEDVHMTIGHIIAQALKARIAAEAEAA